MVATSFTLLDGRVARSALILAMKARVARLRFVPELAVFVVGDRTDSRAYVRQKELLGKELGITVTVQRLPETITQQELSDLVRSECARSTVNGVIVQLPLPPSLNSKAILEAIYPEKDVDGMTTNNMMRLYAGDTSGFIPATAAGVLALLSHYSISVAGKKVVIIGRSLLVGRPLALLLLAHDATVTICHRKTRDVSAVTRSADIVIVAAGAPHYFGKEYFSPEQVVVDVGINAAPREALQEEITGRKLVGDVVFDEVKNVVSAISPVPGGVGPMTVAALFDNLLKACGV